MYKDDTEVLENFFHIRIWHVLYKRASICTISNISCKNMIDYLKSIELMKIYIDVIITIQTHSYNMLKLALTEPKQMGS